jgi:haloalkane dehalogenase
VLEQNFFGAQVLPAGMNRALTPAEWAVYRAPFRTPRERLPILRWIQQIPIAGDPSTVDTIVRRNQTVLLLSDPAPRLLLYGQPGSVVGASEVDALRAAAQMPASASFPPRLHRRVATCLRTVAARVPVAALRTPIWCHRAWWHRGTAKCATCWP